MKSTKVFFQNKKILILGPGENIKKNKTKIIRFIKEKRPFVIALNSFNSLQEKLVKEIY